MDYTVGSNILLIGGVQYQLIPCVDIVDAILICCDSNYANEQTEDGDQIIRQDLRQKYPTDTKSLANLFNIKIVIKDDTISVVGDNENRVIVLAVSEQGAYIVARKTGVWSYNYWYSPADPSPY